jgi:hypothetical protein
MQEHNAKQNPLPSGMGRVNWWISWEKTKHTLKWTYGDVEDFAGYPVKFTGMQTYARRNFCLVFPRIRYQEWAYLLERRKTITNLLPDFKADGEDDLIDEITLDIFPREYFKNEPRMEHILPMVSVMVILLSAIKWISNKDKLEGKK